MALCVYCAMLTVLMPLCASAANEKLLVELNSIEGADNRLSSELRHSRINPTAALESMKLDLVAFGTDGSILRRLLTEMGPVRSAKTIVRTFAVEAECRQIGSILVNDVTACAPASRARVSTASASRHGCRRCVSTNNERLRSASHRAVLGGKYFTPAAQQRRSPSTTQLR